MVSLGNGWLRYLGAAELVGLARRFRIGEGVHQGRGHVRHLQSGTSASIAPLFPDAVVCGGGG